MEPEHGRFRSEIHHRLFITSDKTLVRNVKVLPGVTLDADHRMVVAVVMVKQWTQKPIRKVRIIKTKGLKAQNIRNEYSRRVTRKIIEQCNDGEEEWEDVKKCIKDAAKEVLGEEWRGGSRKRHTVVNRRGESSN